MGSKKLRGNLVSHEENPKDLPCSAHAKEQEYNELSEEEMTELGRTLSSFGDLDQAVRRNEAGQKELEKVFEEGLNERYEELKEIKNVKTGTTDGPEVQLTMKPMDLYVIDTEKIKTVENVVELIKAMNITFTNPSDLMLPFMIKCGEDEDDRKD